MRENEDLDRQKSRLNTEWTMEQALAPGPWFGSSSFPMRFVAHFQRNVLDRCPDFWSKALRMGGNSALDDAVGIEQKLQRMSTQKFLNISGCDAVLDTDSYIQKFQYSDQ